MANRVRARVYSTGSGRFRTWHYEVHRPGDGAVILYDNTGAFEPIMRTALNRVEALRHMQTAGHDLPAYLDHEGRKVPSNVLGKYPPVEPYPI